MSFFCLNTDDGWKGQFIWWVVLNVIYMLKGKVFYPLLWFIDT